MKSIYFSGVQPTGNMHLGNYLGALKQWLSIQKEHQCILSIVDWHAITVPQNPKRLTHDILGVFALYVACGIDIENNIVFVQSKVKEHLELSWCLSCITPVGWLNRMTQFKDKIAKNPDYATLGLYSYPVLMAADILLYRATHVPVGNDQKQHVELTRNVAQLFNNKVGKDFFAIPEPVIPETGARVMSLRDGTKKMSKSDDSDMSRINLTDSNDLIKKKIQKAKTDSCVIPATVQELENRPEVQNLISILAALCDVKEQDILNRYSGQNFAHFKQELIELLVNLISPIRETYNKLISDPSNLSIMINQSNDKASNISVHTMNQVKEFMGPYM